ncbi:MAG: DUF4105 domain-containing protein [Sulfurimonas sp.]|nr:DUF4105 domain-containing protein [Sulfurimonas sp.]
MVDEESEIDDSSFFFSKSGKTNAKDELDATLDAFFNEERFDDNSSACLFPARKAWLAEKLDIDDFPAVECREYDETLKRLNPKSATLVFPAAHINSPASMFGHTFLRINSAYKSRLLSYAINYAADANPDDTNAAVFAVKGLFGGYFGKYSLLPYYEKLKEYRDTEQRDIWEYDLNLNEEEVLRMTQHIWELNGTQSDYYFFTENCSYNMLWLIELARPTVHIREYFHFEVIPLETVHAAKAEGLISEVHYRASKRSTLLKYEELLDDKYLGLPKKLVEREIKLQEIVSDESIPLQQKQYILEASTEFLEYSFSKSDMQKSEYIKLFYNLSKERASLGMGEKLHMETPQDPIESHRAIRVTAGVGSRKGEAISFLGIRPAYHDLEDSNYGFLRGTQIEFLNIELSYSEDEVEVEEATILSIVSLAQRSEFFDSLSWRTKFGFDREYLDNETNFIATVGAGYSWGNEFAYTYMMIDPLFYVADESSAAVGGSLGVVFDKYDFMSTNIEVTRRYYDNGDEQNLAKVAQSFRLLQNLQLKFKYDYKEIESLEEEDEQTFRAFINYYF